MRYPKRVVPALALLMAMTVGSSPPLTVPLANDFYEFSVTGTQASRGATGVGRLTLSWSPFGVNVTAEGHVVYNLELQVDGLRPTRVLGAQTVNVVWITTPELDRIEKLGVLDEAGVLRVPVASMNKFILLITAEPNGDVSTRSGPILARGISPSGLMQSFGNHELFSNIPHE